MKERPILFNGEMVRAILAGKKTQTRRIMKSQPPDGHAPIYMAEPPQTWLAATLATKPPYFVGDRLWVRETWAIAYVFNKSTGGEFSPEGAAHQAKEGLLWYRANGEQEIPEGLCLGDLISSRGRWRPSIHMPKWAARIWLEVTAVRVERLKDISEGDAKAEGMEPCIEFVDDIPLCKTGFMLTWERLYGIDAWSANPWVWVIEFRRIEK